MKASKTCRRLDGTLVPKHYHIALVASPSKPRFKGEVSLQANLTRASKELVLHARDLEIVAARAEQRGRSIALAARTLAEDECVALAPIDGAHALAPGPIALYISFRGTLAASMHGLYLAKDGPEVALVTQCAASDARAILPCLDEPAFKATFAWQVTTEAGLDVIANGAPTGIERHKQHCVHHFAPTAPMSTYLLAVTIGQFEAGRKKLVAGTPCRIWAGRGKAAQTAFALQVTAKVLPWYTNYFKSKYVYHKLDQVAVLGFDAGAMENCGAIFYRQSLLLLTLGQTSRQVQKRSAEVIAHEIAHQWFGNLVTMQWWDDLWLNEAFATWVAFKVCDSLWPEWEIWLDYLEAKEAALAADALATTHPIYAPVSSPAEATELFDVITYEKGCGVLRMAERYLGPDVFRAGIRRYIAKHKFGNAEGKDLWHELGAASGQDMASVMQAWIKTPGFPLVSCDLIERDGQSVLKLSQQRFFESAGGGESPTQGLWPIPLVIAYHDGKRLQHKRHLLRKKSEDVVLSARAGSAALWAYANDDASGFFRLKQSPALKAKVLNRGLPHCNTATRLAMLTDEWALTRAGHNSIGHTLDTFVAMAEDGHPSIVRAIAGRLRSLANVLLHEDDLTLYRDFVAHFAQLHLQRLGDDVERKRPAAEASMLATLLELQGIVARDPKTLALAKRWQQKEQQQPAALDANIAGSMVALSAVDAGVGHYRSLLATYQARKNAGATPEHQGRYLGALCMAEADGPLGLVLAACLSGDIPQEQLRSVIAVLLQRRRGQATAWQWLTKNWASVAPKIGHMGIARLVEATGALPYAYKKEVQAFFAAHPVPQAARAIEKSAEAMALWHELKQREQQNLGNWLRSWAAAKGGPDQQKRSEDAGN